MKVPHFVLAGAFASYAIADGGYAKDCQDMTIVQSDEIFSLKASCKVGNKSQCSVLDLWNCYETDDGILKPKDKGNQPRCKSCDLSGTMLECDCPSSHRGHYVKSSIDTNDLIVNDQGVLKCFNKSADNCAQKPSKSGCGNNRSLNPLGYILPF
ncbi:uncharacterized protein F4812DRAFT_470251 [Daldinia caldariorum]|uniref:uncharacterized protein n=1 Tax=Daldinia caldariorum TaxID=326644 RepID=UPI00200809E3|nr:uncharacterized protein F4812DRAFT_470251 [Daldinia caldariorum]KAI1469156.1 hypothetical protein F4812DRAFT_470251 [Daldinia caldariorum]